ncbi:MAG: sce7726 family protein [Lachnospiraceae bacterium]|nr:sce7726 family protein [Lachnospiraceae bacterium]
MKEVYRTSDKDIRESLYDFLENEYGKVRILDEKRTGKARADIVMVTEDALYGIEIKSDRDSYTRLEGQVRNYDMYYDRNIVVVGSSHAAHIEEHVPEYWGIIVAEAMETGSEPGDAIDFYVLRKPEINPLLKSENKITILWRPELAHIQQINGLYMYAAKSKQYVQRYILDSVPEEILWKQVSEELFERDYTTIFDEINAYRTEHGHKKRRRRRKNKYNKA